MPFSRDACAISSFFEDGGQCGPFFFDEWRIVGTKGDFVFELCAPAIAPGEQGIARGGTYG